MIGERVGAGGGDGARLLLRLLLDGVDDDGLGDGRCRGRKPGLSRSWR